jgi:hypothetical protein
MNDVDQERRHLVQADRLMDHLLLTRDVLLALGNVCLDAVGPPDRPWMWASGHSATTVKRAAHGYGPTREAAMAAFAKSWRRE